MAQYLYLLQQRSNSEGAVYQNITRKGGIVAAYYSFGTACDALNKYRHTYECLRIVRIPDDVVLREVKREVF